MLIYLLSPFLSLLWYKPVLLRPMLLYSAAAAVVKCDNDFDSRWLLWQMPSAQLDPKNDDLIGNELMIDSSFGF